MNQLFKWKGVASEKKNGVIDDRRVFQTERSGGKCVEKMRQVVCVCALAAAAVLTHWW